VLIVIGKSHHSKFGLKFQYQSVQVGTHHIKEHVSNHVVRQFISQLNIFQEEFVKYALGLSNKLNDCNICHVDNRVWDGVFDKSAE
jgi:hypothetical protein